LRYDPSTNRRNQNGASAAENGAGLLLSPAQRGDDERYARLPREAAEHLATAMAVVLGELDRTRHALYQREAELAAGVPVVARASDEEHLAQRLEAALEAGVQAVGADAAALYLLDEGTSQLKLRACFGLPHSRMLDQPRELRGAIADLEALLGQAVVIEDTALLPHWRCPEDVPAAMCVPVSTANTPLGTLWIFSQTPRDFTTSQTNLVEIVAGRIASDLEREMLLTNSVETKSLERDLREAAQWQAEHLPSIAPLIDDWDVAGATQSGGELTSEFFDWSVLPDGNLALALGDAHGRAVAAGLSAAALHAAMKAHAGYRHDAAQMLSRVNETLWSTSPGGQFASLFYGLISPECGTLDCAASGRLTALIVKPDGYLTLPRGSALLGSDDELITLPQQQAIPPGGALVVASDGVLSELTTNDVKRGEIELAQLVRASLGHSATEIIERLQSALGESASMDRTLLVLKRLR
jgi:serine phosphatase RsbU (regulator of sigma subunit)